MIGFRQLHGKDAVVLIPSVLGVSVKTMTTRLVQEETEKRMIRCPDSTAVFFNKLRFSSLTMKNVQVIGD